MIEKLHSGDRVRVSKVTLYAGDTFKKVVYSFLGEEGKVLFRHPLTFKYHVCMDSGGVEEFDSDELELVKNPDEQRKNKSDIVKHLEYMVEDIESYAIPAQISQDAIDIFQKDKLYLKEAIKYLKEG